MSSVLVRNGSWRWLVATLLAAVLSTASFVALQSSARLGTAGSGSSGGTSTSSPLSEVAASNPAKRVEVIVQLRPGADQAKGAALTAAAGGVVERQLPIINGFSTTLRAAKAEELAASPAVHAVSLNAAVEHEGLLSASDLETSYNQSIRSTTAWSYGKTGEGIGVAVIDTGIQGDLVDFQDSRWDDDSRVVASAVTNPAATTADDTFGHGTHVAGLIAGNGENRSWYDRLEGDYIGVAPDADLIAVKASDDAGNASVLDVIDGLQFVVEKKNYYDIRVVNLSLRSTIAESYRTDPLDAAVEAAWNAGIVVVVAAGNDGNSADAVQYAPANDPYVITVGGVDDVGTSTQSDDFLASWSSRGTTQDGFAKPDVLAPGARLVSTIPAGSEYTELCPTCIVDGQYFRVGGTSMAAGVVSGAVADLLEARPYLSPDQVKTQLMYRSRPVYKSQASSTLVDASGASLPGNVTTASTVIGAEIALDKALFESVPYRSVNSGLTPNSMLNRYTGQIDWNRASWSRASWSNAVAALRASWSRASWSRASWSRASWSATPESCADFERASWSRASWSRASWSRASWSRASWSADGMSSAELSSSDMAQIDAEIAAAKHSCSQLLAEIDPTRASWSRASWSRASWSTSFNK